MSMPEPTPRAFLGAPPVLRPVDATTNLDADASVVTPTSYAADAPPGTRSVVYLRVSSKGQVNTDYDPEGISIPAQRLSCERKAQTLGLNIVAEYVEPGRSGTEMTKRVAFQQMLERIRREKDVDYVIVYELSRFARNRLDDAIVMADLQKRGVVLVSATEQIDETPVGQLMHGLLAAFNEYRSAKDGADIAYKMGQKAKNGGTLGRAPIGYLNATENIDGRRINTIAVDLERAPFVKLAFELYAKRNFTLETIVDELTDRGLTTRPTARRPVGPISVSKVHQLLRDRYYLGEVRYKDEYYPGRHQPIVTEELFDRVQELMDTRGFAGERRRTHDHYLKGTLWCGRCRLEDRVDRRMIMMRATGRQGNEYWYFFCRGVQDHICDAPYSNMDRVEEAIEEHYKTIQFQPEFVAAIRQSMEAALADSETSQRLLSKQLQDQLTGLNAKEENLLDLAADGSLPQAKIRERLRSIARDRERLAAQLTTVHDDLSGGMAYIDAHLALLEQPYELYQHASDETRRKLNQAIFAHIYVVHDEVIGDELNSPLGELLAAERAWSAFQADLGEETAQKAARLELARHSPQNKQSAPEGNALSNVLLTDLLTAAQNGGDCSKPSMVRPEGFEPPAY
jgi:site-specific DNA recombinase